MKIEALREPTVRGGRYTVTLDDGRRLRLEQATVGEFALYPGRELTAEELDRIRAANQRASAKARAVRIISATNVSKRIWNGVWCRKARRRNWPPRPCSG